MDLGGSTEWWSPDNGATYVYHMEKSLDQLKAILNEISLSYNDEDGYDYKKYENKVKKTMSKLLHVYGLMVDDFSSIYEDMYPPDNF